MEYPYLSVRGLQAGYGRAQVLFDTSFDVRPGEVVTLLGRNGMGRSTTIECLFGMLASQPARRARSRSGDCAPSDCRRIGSRVKAWRWCRKAGRSSPS